MSLIFLFHLWEALQWDDPDHWTYKPEFRRVRS
jgi:hypothetical protein